MATPIITATQTVLAWAVGQEFSFQFNASGTPTAWRVAPGYFLPNGVLLDTVEGRIYGSGTIAGVWDIMLIASNAEGDSDPILFTIGLFDLPQEKDVSKIAQINTGTWQVTLPDPFAAVQSVNAASTIKTTEVIGSKTIETSSSAGGTDVSMAAAIGGVRYGDVVTFMLKFTESSSTPGSSAGVEVFPRLQSARFSIKGFDTDPVFFVTEDWNYKTAIFFEQGGYFRRYFVTVNFSNAALLSFLGDYESDGGTSANCLCEFQFSFKRHPGAGIGELDIITTQPFLLRVHRDSI